MTRSIQDKAETARRVKKLSRRAKVLKAVALCEELDKICDDLKLFIAGTPGSMKKDLEGILNKQDLRIGGDAK